jgi:hypothetical protein
VDGKQEASVQRVAQSGAISRQRERTSAEPRARVLRALEHMGILYVGLERRELGIKSEERISPKR